jgi:hypothetical protein
MTMHAHGHRRVGLTRQRDLWHWWYEGYSSQPSKRRFRSPTPRRRSRSESEPARTYAEFARSLADRECTLLLKHTPNLDLTDNFG